MFWVVLGTALYAIERLLPFLTTSFLHFLPLCMFPKSLSASRDSTVKVKNKIILAVKTHKAKKATKHHILTLPVDHT